MQPVVGLPREHDGTVLGRPLRAPLSQHGRDAVRKQLRAIERENGFHTYCTFPLESSTITWSPRISTSGSVYPVQHSVGYSEHGAKWNSRAARCVTTVSFFTNDNKSKVNRLSYWCWLSCGLTQRNLVATSCV